MEEASSSVQIYRGWGTTKNMQFSDFLKFLDHWKSGLVRIFYQLQRLVRNSNHLTSPIKGGQNFWVDNSNFKFKIFTLSKYILDALCYLKKKIILWMFLGRFSAKEEEEIKKKKRKLYIYPGVSEVYELRWLYY